MEDESEEEVGLWLMKTYFEDFAQEESREERCGCKPPCVRSIFKLVPWSSDSKRYNWQDTFVHFHVRGKTQGLFASQFAHILPISSRGSHRCSIITSCTVRATSSLTSVGISDCSLDSAVLVWSKCLRNCSIREQEMPQAEAMRIPPRRGRMAKNISSRLFASKATHAYNDVHFVFCVECKISPKPEALLEK